MRDSILDAFHEVCDLFVDHIPLFIKKRDIILKEPRYYSVVYPSVFYDTFYAEAERANITLGEMLLLWEKEKMYQTSCPICKSDAITYSFLGSPLSGTVHTYAVCLSCGEQFTETNGSTHALRKTRCKYTPNQPVAESPVTIKELISILEG
jgi:hypothetical protein